MNQFGISGLPESWIMLGELHGDILCLVFSFFYLASSNTNIKQYIKESVGGHF